MRDARDVSVISGQQEGSHEWMAVNYLLGSVVEGEDRLSAAVLGMGGASTQLALVSPSAPLRPVCPIIELSYQRGSCVE